MSDRKTRYECLSCGITFVFDTLKMEGPEYCPACGKPRNEQFGMDIAASNPNITGFVNYES